MKLRALRTTPRTVGFYFNDLHVIGFRPRRPHGTYSSWGGHLRYRRRNGTWRHFLIRLFQKAEPIPGGIGAWTWEAQSYDTLRAGSIVGGNRLTIKKFIRLKVGLGGRYPA